MKLTYKKIVFFALLFVSTAMSFAQSLAVQQLSETDAKAFGLPITDVSLKRNDDQMSITMNLGFSELELKGDRAAVFVPVLSNGSNSLELEPVGIYSRIRYIQYLRSGSEPLGGQDEISFRYADRPEMMEYAQVVPYADWMNGAQLYLRRLEYACCRTLVGEDNVPLTTWKETLYVPQYNYATPVAETVKMRELSGQAFIDFPVNRTEIYPDYRSNPSELAKIIATIDSVRNDKDITVRRITIKGYASPEGSYENNTRLAKGRTEALKQYVRNLYNFDNDFISTDYEPEDWAGLRRYVEQSNLEHKAEILAIIDDATLPPDPKDWRIRIRYTDDYNFLLETVYPALRHSDYTIEYTIRQFSGVDEIRKVMETSPQKLSLDEMFLLAQSLEEGSKEYDEVFETAVRMYPNDEIANLNAANSAMRRNDFASAERYLAKAGESNAAVYARAVYATLRGDYDTAAGLYSRIAAAMPEAAEALQLIEDMKQGK